MLSSVPIAGHKGETSGNTARAEADAFPSQHHTITHVVSSLPSFTARTGRKQGTRPPPTMPEEETGRNTARIGDSPSSKHKSLPHLASCVTPFAMLRTGHREEDRIQGGPRMGAEQEHGEDQEQEHEEGQSSPRPTQPAHQFGFCRPGGQLHFPTLEPPRLPDLRDRAVFRASDLDSSSEPTPWIRVPSINNKR